MGSLKTQRSLKIQKRKYLAGEKKTLTVRQGHVQIRVYLSKTVWTSDTEWILGRYKLERSCRGVERFNLGWRWSSYGNSEAEEPRSPTEKIREKSGGGGGNDFYQRHQRTQQLMTVQIIHQREFLS